jgi:acylglycerol lipase
LKQPEQDRQQRNIKHQPLQNMAHWFTRDHTVLRYTDINVPPPVPTNLPLGQRCEFIRSWDNRLWLFQRQWLPVGRPIVATLMILHGTVDHSGVYHELGMALSQQAGISVFATDMRGWGLSDGESLYFHNMATFVKDVEAQYTVIHDRLPNVQHRFLLGKSIGGLIAAYLCAQKTVHFTGLVGLSGAFQVDACMIPPAPIMGLLHCLNTILPKLPLKKLFPPALIVSDEAAIAEWKADPLVRRGRLTVGYIMELLRCSQELPSLELTHEPMLMMWGTDDKVVTLAGHEQMIAATGTDVDATLKTYPGGRHNLLADPMLKEQVISDIRDWVVAHCKSS